MERYLLKHKNDICGIVSLDKDTGQLQAYENIDPGKAPFLGNATTANMRKWWAIRAVPGTRSTFMQVLRDNDCVNGEAYLAKNLGLSLNDAYWICPIEAKLDYDDINLYEQRQYYRTKIPFHNATSYDPNASLSGQMEKYWDVSQDTPILVKTASTFHGQQAINESFASLLHKRLNAGIEYTDYMIRRRSSDNSLQCLCKSFTSKEVEFVPAYEIIESCKRKNERFLYDTFIDICAENGIDRESAQKYMDYQTLTDFIISNTDEHLLNFGVLRDVETMKFICPAPIFDSGNSMFYSEDRTKPLSRIEILGRKITSFHDSEEKMISHIKNVDIVDISRLPSVQETKDFYLSNGIMQGKAEFIAANYKTKIEMACELQRGIKISLYRERKE